jgi:hypothetical protein
MTKLNDLQLILLSSASQREDGHFLPLPDAAKEKAAAANKALAALLKKGFASEVHTKDVAQQWREDGEWRIGLVITEAGLKAIDAGDEPPKDTPGAQQAPPATAPTQSKPNLREGSKQKLVVDLLSREGGASIAELVEATGWLPHTTRAALTGLKKRGFVIASQKVEGVSRYRIEVDGANSGDQA